MRKETLQVKIRLTPELVDRLKVLQKKYGPINDKTKQKRPFSVFLRHILVDYAYDMEKLKMLDSLTAEDYKNDPDWN